MADSRSIPRDVAAAAAGAQGLRAGLDGDPEQTRALLAAIVDSSYDAIVSKTLDGIILSWNSAAERLFGYPAADAVGQHITLIIPPERRHEEADILRRLRRGERIDPFETVRVTRDGRRLDISLTISPVRDSAGRIVAASKIARDITQRKQAEAALIEQTRIADTLNRIGSALAAELDLERIVQLVTDEATAVTTADYGAFFHNVTNGGGESYALYTSSGAPREAFSGFPMPRNTPLFEPTFRGDCVVRVDDVTLDPRFGRNPPHRGLPPGHLPVKSYLAVPVVSRTGDVLGGLFFAHEQAGVFNERHERIVLGIAAQAAIAIDNANLYARVQESDQRFRQLAQHATDVFWIFDLSEHRMLYVSPAYEEMWGRSAEGLYVEPRSFLDSVHPDDRARVLDALERQQQGESTAEEYRIVRGDGTSCWVWDRGFPIHDDRGEVVRVAGITEDITERKDAEDRLRESEERYRRLTQLLPVAVYTCEAGSGVLTYYNDKAVELWGRAPPLGDPEHRFCGSLTLLRPDGQRLPHEECPMAVAMAENRSFRNQDVVIERPDGSRITALVNIEPITDAAGRVTGAINVCLDVSALKNAERQLLEADRRKDEFLATLSHELRNPLAPIRYALEMIDRAGGDPHAVAQSRDVLERQVTQLVRLIEDLLDVSRITHDKLALRKETTDLASVVQQAVEVSRPLLDQDGHRLTVRLPEQTLPLHVDTVRVVQVLGNLLSNAGKYTPPGGAIELVAETDGEQVQVSVRDTGKGIPAEQLDSIFEMFTQSGSSRQMQGGLGIGLTLVKRLVEMHGGSVSASSDGPGTGSTFVVRLPAAAPDASAGTRRPGDEGTHAQRVPEGLAEADAAPAPPRRILIVDDNRDTADALAMLLSMAGHQTETAYDGVSCLEVTERFRPEVVLLDLGLPKLDGYEVCQALRRQIGGDSMTVAAVTGWGQAKDREKTRAAGFDEHLVKPVDLKAVDALLKSLAPRYDR